MIVALVGFLDSGYLTWGYYSGAQLKCTIFEGCNTVLASGYSVLFWNIPNALLGMVYYGLVVFLLVVYLVERAELALRAALALVLIGVLFSLYFIYLQIFVIGAICIYCMVSAFDTALLAVLLPIAIRKLKYQ